jgi:hypothetical protein
MHWLSDIIGSTLLASSILFIHILSYQRSEIKKLNIKALTFFALFIVTSVSGLLMFNGLNKSIQASQLKKHFRLTKIEKWWDGKIRLPIHRENRFGTHVAPLNIQWAMPINNIQNILKKHNWVNIKNLKLSHRFKNILSSSKNHLALFHKLYHNQPPSLIMIKDSQIIRLWPSSVKFFFSKIPLWVGTISYIHHEKSSILPKIIKKHMKLQENYLPSKILSKELRDLKIKPIKIKSLKEVLLITDNKA